MLALNSRNQSLLILLLLAKTPISTQELARELGISPRMVRYSLEMVAVWLAGEGIDLLKKPGAGVLLEADQPARQALLHRIRKEEAARISFTKNERLQILLLTLVTRSEPITAKQLQQRLYVSRTTVLKDLDRVEQWLSNFDLLLHRRQNVGFMVLGEEANVRRAFVYSLLENIEEAQLLDILYQRRISSANWFGFLRVVIEFLVGLDLSFYSRLVTDLCDEFELKLLDRSHAALVLEVAFQIDRIKRGKLIEQPHPNEAAPSDHKHAAMTSALAKKVAANQGLVLPEAERAYLLSSLENASERRHAMVIEEKWMLDAHERQKLLEEIPLEVLNTVEAFISNISLYLHPALQVDIELTRSLANHMHHLMQQKHPREQIPNPLYRSIIKQYQHVSQLVTKHAHILNALLKQDMLEEEIGYIAMYVAAAMERLFIPSSKKKALIVGDIPRATISLLISRLRFEFANIEIAGILSYMEYQKQPFQIEHELVIATHPLQAESAPVVLVNPLLPPADVARLEKFMRPTRELAYPRSEVSRTSQLAKTLRIKDLLDDKTVLCKVEANSWEQVVDVATRPLYQMHRIEHRYIISIKEIIRKSGPYMVIWPRVVLLHALPEEGVRELCMSLVTLRTPVYFGHEHHDPVEIAIVLGAIDKTSHLPALFDLNELIQNSNAKENLTSTYHKSRILQIVSSFKYTHHR